MQIRLVPRPECQKICKTVSFTLKQGEVCMFLSNILIKIIHSFDLQLTLYQDFIHYTFDQIKLKQLLLGLDIYTTENLVNKLK